ncbi:MAG: hypothetical protein ACYDA4_05165, partial [Ignavibacteriaceae bacterium]
MSTYINNCVADGFNSATLSINASHDNLFVTNTEFRDAANPGGGPSWVNGAVPIDTIDFENDTFFEQYHAFIGELGWVGYLRFEHNTCFFNENQPLVFPQLFNGVIENNIFYALADFGADSTKIETHLSSPAFNQLGLAIIDLDSLTSLLHTPYNLTEAGRNVKLTNNDFYWPQGLYTYWKSVSDTAADHGEITPPHFMTDRTVSMFNDKNVWPGLSSSYNDSVDPGFSSSLVTLAVDTMIKAISIRWIEGTQGGFRANPLPTNPLNVYASVPADWASTQGYPV